MKKILLIEDNIGVRENTTEILQLANYEVIAVENGKLGVEAATTQVPDIIICDIMMPEMDGYGVLHMLSRNPKTASIPFIFLTAKAERSDMRKGMQMGADDYITKPFDDLDLLNAVEMRLKKNELLKAEFAATADGINSFLQVAGNSVELTSDEREIIQYKKKQVIYTVDKHPYYLYLVLKGNVKTSRLNDDGKELTTAMYKTGDFFGYTSLLEDTVYTDSAEALDDSEVMLIPKAEFLSLLNQDSMVARRFIKILAQNLVDKEEQLLNLAYNSLRKRIATSLLHVNEQFKTEDDEHPIINMSREEMAQLVGTAKESLIRTLSDFKSEKLIEIADGKIKILQEKKLREMLN